MICAGVSIAYAWLFRTVIVHYLFAGAVAWLAWDHFTNRRPKP